jgi:hypothetical protein
LKIFQEEELEDSEESGDYDNDEGLEAFGGPRGQIEASVAESYEFLESRGFITKRKKRPTPNDSVLGHEDHHVVAWYHKGAELRNSRHTDTTNSIFFHKFDIIHHWDRVRSTSSRDASWATSFYGKKAFNVTCNCQGDSVTDFQLKGNFVNANLDLGRNLIKKPYGPPRMCNQVHNFSYISRDFGT